MHTCANTHTLPLQQQLRRQAMLEGREHTPKQEQDVAPKQEEGAHKREEDEAETEDEGDAEAGVKQEVRLSA